MRQDKNSNFSKKKSIDNKGMSIFFHSTETKQNVEKLLNIATLQTI